MILRKGAGGALQFVVVIGLLIATLVLSFMLLLDLNQSHRIKQELKLSSFKKANATIIRSLIQPVQNSERSTTMNFSDEMKLKDEIYGVFIKRSCTINQSQINHNSVAFVGVKKSSENAQALHLANNFSPLYVVGKTSIQGQVEMSKEGIRIGNLSEKPFQGQLNIQRHKPSSPELPLINKNLNLFFESIDRNENFETADFLTFPKNYSHSFKSKTHLFSSDEALLIENTQLDGNLVILSNQKITVDSTARLTDVILLAPEIVIKNGVKGRFQALATSKMKIESSCQLDYPSVLWLQQNKSSSSYSGDLDFIIERGTEISGLVGFTKSWESKNMMPVFKIYEGVRVNGEVYSQVPLDIIAQIKGTLYAKNLISYHKGKFYSNHLIDTQLLALQKDEVFSGFTFEDTPPNTVIKWLD